MNSYVGNTPTTGHFPTDTFTSSGGSTYTLSQAPATTGSIEVSVQGVLQAVSAYTISGTTLTLAGVTSGDVIFVRHLGETLQVPVPVDDSVTTAKILDANVTTAKIADANVTTAKILDGNVTLAKLVDPSATNKLLGRTTAGNGDWEEVAIQTTLTSTDESIPTSKAVRDDIVSLVNDVGGFVAVADDQSFPNTNPDPDDGVGTVVSIANAGG